MSLLRPLCGRSPLPLRSILTSTSAVLLRNTPRHHYYYESCNFITNTNTYTYTTTTTTARMSTGRTVTLNSGHKIPTLGYGTWQAKPGEVGAGVYEALKIGYRHLDLAKVYQNQKEVGEGIKKALADVPGLKREDIFITSKLWNNSHRPEDVPAALEDTLKELQLEYLDLYLIHWPVAFAPGAPLFPKTADGAVALNRDVTISQTWKAVTELPKSKVRTVGVSNFTIEHLETVIKDTGVVPAVNQIERHPRLPDLPLVKFAADKGIVLTAYSAFGNNTKGLPLLVNSDEVKAIADRLSKVQGKDVKASQVILAWSQLGGHTVIPKSVTASRIKENFEEVELDEEAVKALEKLGEDPQRFNIPATYNPGWNVNLFNTEIEKEQTTQGVVLKL